MGRRGDELKYAGKEFAPSPCLPVLASLSKTGDITFFKHFRKEGNNSLTSPRYHFFVRLSAPKNLGSADFPRVK